MTNIQWLAIAGVVLNLFGVILLFRYGMPFRVETKGQSRFLLEGIDEDAIHIEARYKLAGYAGVFLIIAGSVLQILAVAFA